MSLASFGQRPRVARRRVHGVLLLDKALGATSNGALQQAKRLYRRLDPQRREVAR